MTVAEPQIVDAQKAKNISLEECRQHTTEQDCWLVVHGKVYDITTFLDEHPGGFDIILANTGMLAPRSCGALVWTVKAFILQRFTCHMHLHGYGSLNFGVGASWLTG